VQGAQGVGPEFKLQYNNNKKKIVAWGTGIYSSVIRGLV
jgi:hypothetical protein